MVESVEGDVSCSATAAACTRARSASTRIYDGERVWHLTFRVRERHELRPRQARIALALSERTLLGEERSLPRVACRLAATASAPATPPPRPGRACVDVSQGGLALRSGATYGAGDLIDVDLDDGTGAVISARVEVVDLIATSRRLARARIVAVADDGAQRLGALVDRLRNSPSDGEPEPEPLPALREALRRRSPPAAPETLATLSAVELSYVTSGESHGPGITAVVSGLPAGLALDREAIRADLARRQAGYGRSPRQRIEQDDIEILGGVRHGLTLGGPLALIVRNRDHANWGAAMSAWPVSEEELAEVAARRSRKVQLPRPGHADLSGVMKYDLDDVRNVLERASARETAARVAVGAITKGLLALLGIGVFGRVLAVGDVAAAPDAGDEAAFARARASEIGCSDPAAEKRMLAAIDEAAADRDTLGGIIEIRAFGCPPGLGSHTEPRLRLDARLAAAAVEHPGHEGRRDRRRVRQRAPAGLGRARRAAVRRRARLLARDATARAASRAACRTASRSSCASR